MSGKRLTVESSSNVLIRARHRRLRWAPGGIVLFMVVVVAALVIQQTLKRKHERDIKLQLQQFYDRKLVPLADAARQRNRKAADRAIQSLHVHFQGHHAGVKPFAEEVTGL